MFWGPKCWWIIVIVMYLRWFYCKRVIWPAYYNNIRGSIEVNLRENVITSARKLSRYNCLHRWAAKALDHESNMASSFACMFFFCLKTTWNWIYLRLGRGRGRKWRTCQKWPRIPWRLTGLQTTEKSLLNSSTVTYLHPYAEPVKLILRIKPCFALNQQLGFRLQRQRTYGFASASSAPWLLRYS